MAGKTRVNSKKKGAAGERELAHLLVTLFDLNPETTCRGRQYSGSPESPDVISEMKMWHIECKRVNRLNIHSAYEQSARDAGREQIPVVMHRADRQPWFITLRLDQIRTLAQKIVEFTENHADKAAN